MQDFPAFPIAFGGAAISGEGRGYGFGNIKEADAIDLVHAAFDLGIRVFDTAPIYGFGLSEKRLGLAFKSRREDVFIVSKAGVTWNGKQRVDKSNDPKVVQRMLNQSLKDLKTDYIDLYMMHWPDEKQDIRYALEVLRVRQEKGDIKYIGLCNSFEEDFNKASEVATISAIQDSWNAFSHFETYERYAFLKDNKAVWKMGYATLDKGILTARVDEKRTFDADDCRSWAPWWKNQKKEKKYQLVRALQDILPDYSLTLLDFALHFAKDKHSFMDVNLVGPKNQKQLAEIIKSIRQPVLQSTIDEITQRWEAAGYTKEVANA